MSNPTPLMVAEHMRSYARRADKAALPIQAIRLNRAADLIERQLDQIATLERSAASVDLVDRCDNCETAAIGHNFTSDCKRCGKEVCDACEEGHWNSEECS